MRGYGPALCLVAYGVAFAAAAFGSGVPAAGRHPEQLFRLWHALERSFPRGHWTADWSPDWWGGYPELQFTPPGPALVGAAIRLLGLWQPSVELVYQLLCGVVLVLPGLATFGLLAAALRDRWLALPPAFLALTLAGGLSGGLEDGLRQGMLASRLSLGFLPLFVLALRPWVEAGRPPIWAPPAAAAVVLAHPASLPAALLTLGVATLLVAAKSRARRTLAEALTIAGTTLALIAFWILPRLWRGVWAVPLAAGDRTLTGLASEVGGHPVLLGIALAAPLAWVPVFLHRRPFDTLLAALPIALVGGFALNLALFRHGWTATEPRLFGDTALFAGLWAAGLGVFGVATATVRRARGSARPLLALVTIGLVTLISALVPGRAGGEPDLMLWPRAAEWPHLDEVSRAHRLPELWATLRGKPDRVLFLRAWPRRGASARRPPSHVLSLAPLFAHREIVDGTSTHPAPLARRFYTGHPARPARLETLEDGLVGPRLLGQPWAELSPRTFDAFARRLRITTVVLPTPEAKQARFLEKAYTPTGAVGDFTVFERRERPWAHQIERITHRRYRVLVSPAGGVWIPTGIPAYPLWHAKSGHGPLPTRVDAWGLLELRVPLAVFEAELVYAEGWLEWLSLGATLVGGLTWLRRARRFWRRSPSHPGPGPLAARRRRHHR